MLDRDSKRTVASYLLPESLHALQASNRLFHREYSPNFELSKTKEEIRRLNDLLPPQDCIDIYKDLNLENIKKAITKIDLKLQDEVIVLNQAVGLKVAGLAIASALFKSIFTVSTYLDATINYASPILNPAIVYGGAMIAAYQGYQTYQTQNAVRANLLERRNTLKKLYREIHKLEKTAKETRELTEDILLDVIVGPAYKKPNVSQT